MLICHRMTQMNTFPVLTHLYHSCIGIQKGFRKMDEDEMLLVLSHAEQIRIHYSLHLSIVLISHQQGRIQMPLAITLGLDRIGSSNPTSL